MNTPAIEIGGAFWFRYHPSVGISDTGDTALGVIDTLGVRTHSDVETRFIFALPSDFRAESRNATKERSTHANCQKPKTQ